MATQIIMPKLGMAMKEGMLAKWVKEDGAQVNTDDTIAVIVTKKITYELKSPTAGILRWIVRPKESRPVGAVIAYLLAPGESIPEPGAGAAPAAGKGMAEPAISSALAADQAEKPVREAGQAVTYTPPPPGEFVVASPAARRLARESGIELRLVPGTGPNGRISEEDVRAYQERLAQVLVTSAARKLAAEYGLDLSQISGSGPGGRITEADVHKQLAIPEQEAEPPPVAAAIPGRQIPFAGLRQMIAENMLQSLQSMAQVTLSTEVDVTELVALRDRLKKDFDLTYTDLLVKALTIALKRHPRLNAALDGEYIRLLEEIHIGVGVALDEGLIVPVIHHADKLSLKEISAAVNRLASKARSGSLEMDEVSGGTFTITNLGAFGIDMFTPIINPPEVAILGVGRIVEKLALYNGEAARRWRMVLSLTFDHRLVDGAPAAAFIQTLSDILSHPYFLGAEAYDE